MANKRGAHQRGNASQQSYGNSQHPDGREAYEQAYQRYIQEQAAARRAARMQGGQGQAGYQRDDWQQGSYQQTAYQRPASSQQRAGYQTAQSSRGYGQFNDQSWNAVPKKKRHPVRNTIIVLLIFVLLVGGFGGFTGYTLYNSAKTVRADASAVMSGISDLRGQIISEQPEQANATATDIAKRAKAMKEETSGWAWTVGSYIPVYGSDISKVRELSNVFDDLATQAIVPLVSEASQVSLKNLLTDGAINVDMAQRLVAAVDSAAPIIAQSAATVNKMGDAKLEQVNGPLTKARESLDSLNKVTSFVAGIAPTFSEMIGVGSQRTYLIIAQSCSEIRSTGGFIGTVGTLKLNNGQIELGDFIGISQLYPRDLENMYAPITAEEESIFGMHVSYQVADMSYIPDFARVSQMVKYAWEDHGFGHVDGTIGVDPMFLQDILGLVGGVTTSTGFTVDGTNTAQVLLRDVYYLPTNDEQDAVFHEVAALAFSHLMSNLGDVQITKLANVVNNGFATRHLQLWMESENEQKAIAEIGADGCLPHDETAPTLGVYFSEESYSKLYWYFKVDSMVGDGTKNADGSTTYPVTVTYHNMIQPDQVGNIPQYAITHNATKRSDAEMITWVYLSAPEGGSISDMSAAGDFVPEENAWRKTGGAPITGAMNEATLQGLDFWFGLTRTMPGESFSLSFNVTTSPKATQPLKIIRTPEAQEVAGW